MSIVRVTREVECPLCAVRQPVRMRMNCRHCGVRLRVKATVSWEATIEETDDEGNQDEDGTKAES